MKAPRKGITDATQFYLWDSDATLFPLNMNRVAVERYAKGLRTFIQDKVLVKDGAFLPQHRVFATKRGWFLRRTVKLDPVAEFFLYDLVYRNRTSFRRKPSRQRSVFGFSIAEGKPLSTISEYANFKKAVTRHQHRYKNCAFLDIASYFNHVYHHDIVRWFEDAGAPADDVSHLGKYLREIASGRSVDCLPQGIYPAKMIGSAFLSMVEGSGKIRASRTVRLMDDIWIFDQRREIIVSDFMAIQTMLSDRGLSVNDRKSGVLSGKPPDEEVSRNIDEMKQQLLRKRRDQVGGMYDEPDEHSESLVLLTDDEQAYLLDLLRAERVQEEDAELVLTLMRDHSLDVMELLPPLVEGFPSLAKRIYQFCDDVLDHNELTSLLLKVLRSNAEVTEYQLFWFTKIAEDHLLKSKAVSELLHELYEHENATDVTKAKLLEIPGKQFGLPELREEQLRSGHSDWLAWASAFGSRSSPKGQRNQLLKYFRKASPMNQLIGEFVETCF